MKRKMVAFLAAGALMLASAGAVAASDNYNPPPNAGACGQMHGSFGAFGKENNFAGGADGQQTGANNSAKLCQSHFATTP
jgi:Spy/CpxP family protein refolding chaperone